MQLFNQEPLKYEKKLENFRSLLSAYLDFFFSIVKSKKIFSPPRSASVLVYDYNGYEIFTKYIEKREIEILFVRGERFNIYILIRFVISKIRGRVGSYFYEYIRYVNPSVVLTFVDNDLQFYELKKTFPGIIFIAVQNGVRSYKDDVFEHFDKLISANALPAYQADYIFCYGRVVQRCYEPFIEADYLSIGSINNNYYASTQGYNEVKPSGKEKILLFPSEWRHPPLLEEERESWLLWHQAESEILPVILNFCKRHGFVLKIAGRYDENYGEEHLFYQSILGDKDWVYSPNTGPGSSYDLFGSSDFVVFFNSTIGYEALARKKRSACIAIRNRQKPDCGCNLGWPADLPAEGPFWTNQANEDAINRILSYIVGVSDDEWLQVLRENLSEVIEFDPGNTKLVALLKTLNVPLAERI